MNKRYIISVFVVVVLALLFFYLLRDSSVSTYSIEKISTQCQMDSDCTLVSKIALDYKTCWQHSCQGVDYSSDDYIAVNQKSLQAFESAHAPTKEELYRQCGPPPGCPAFAVNVEYEGRCINASCTKVRK